MAVLHTFTLLKIASSLMQPCSVPLVVLYGLPIFLQITVLNSLIIVILIHLHYTVAACSGKVLSPYGRHCRHLFHGHGLR